MTTGATGARTAGALRAVRALGAAAALLAALPLGCGGRREAAPPAAPPKRFPAPIFDGLSLGMTRSEVARDHSIRPVLGAAGKSRRVWVYDRPGDFSADLTFAEDGDAAKLSRIDAHFGPSGATSDQFIVRFESILGPPDARRRKADVNAYGDRSHEQYETIWSDATQYVFLTERVPVGARGAPSVYYLTVKKKEITATGPPTGYVPPPPPKGKDGKPVEEAPF